MRWQKKAKIVEAVRYVGTKTHAEQIKNWMEGKAPCPGDGYEDHRFGKHEFKILCNQSDMLTARAGDYIVKQSDDDFYPVPPEAFMSIYELPNNDVAIAPMEESRNSIMVRVLTERVSKLETAIRDYEFNGDIQELLKMLPENV